MQKRIFLIGAIALPALATVLTTGTASAAYINGTFGTAFLGSSTYTGPDLADATSTNINSAIYFTAGNQGDFSSFTFPATLTASPLPIPKPANGTLTTYADPVPGLMTFASSDSNRYTYNLSTLGELYQGGVLTLYGTGTLVDNTSVSSATPAEFTLNLTSIDGGATISNGSFTFAAIAPVPEPATLGLVAVASAAALGRRRRKA